MIASLNGVPILGMQELRGAIHELTGGKPGSRADRATRPVSLHRTGIGRTAVGFEYGSRWQRQFVELNWAETDVDSARESVAATIEERRVTCDQVEAGAANRSVFLESEASMLSAQADLLRAEFDRR